MAFPNNRFEGKLDGKTIYYFKKQLDYNLKQSDRISLINKILLTQHTGDKSLPDRYFEEFTSDGYYKVNLSSDDSISENNNVWQEIDKMTNYILFSPDAPRITKKTKYNFYTENKLRQKMGKEISIDEMVENTYQDSDNELDSNVYDETINFLLQKGSNYKKQVKQRVTSDDLIDPGLEPVKNYQDYINSLREKLEGLRKEDKNKVLRKKIMKILEEVKADQIMCKDRIKGTIYFKQVMPDSTVIDYDQFDFFDKKHVLNLLKCVPKGLIHDLGCLVYDLNKLLKDIELDYTECDILNLYRNEDAFIGSIAKALKVEPSFVTATINKIIKKIVDRYEEIYEDWYYLNKVKGKYKCCSKCRKIKLIQNFDKDESKKDGLRPDCKKCRVA